MATLDTVKVGTLEIGQVFRFQGNDRMARYLGRFEHDGQQVWQWAWLGEEATRFTYRAVDAHMPYVVPTACQHVWPERTLNDLPTEFTCSQCGEVVTYW